MTKDELVKFIESDPRLRMIRQKVIEKMTEDKAHDITHFYRVAITALELGVDGGGLDRFEVVAAALMHDFINVPKNSPDRARASTLSALEARKVLTELNCDPDSVTRIADAVEDHSYSRGAKPRSFLGECIQDADRLEGLGALGVMRLVSVGSQFQSEFFEANDPWAKNRPLNDTKYMVDHCFTKLFKLPDLMNTRAGKAEAKRRADYIQNFLDQLAHEIGAPR